MFQLRDGIVTSDDSGTLLAGQWGEGADRIRAEKARQAWRTDSTQLKIRSILQGGKRYTDLAELEPVHTATLVDVLANERQSGRRMFKASSADDKAGRPCSTPIEELCPIEISALRPGEVHTGTVLWVEVVGGSRNVLPNQTLELVPAVILDLNPTSTDFYKVQGGTTIVRDRGGGCCIFSLYNFFDDSSNSLDCQKVIPKGSVIGVCVFVCARARARVCVCTCACVRVCVCACVWLRPCQAHMLLHLYTRHQRTIPQDFELGRFDCPRGPPNKHRDS